MLMNRKYTLGAATTCTPKPCSPPRRSYCLENASISIYSPSCSRPCSCSSSSVAAAGSTKGYFPSKARGCLTPSGPRDLHAFSHAIPSLSHTRRSRWRENSPINLQSASCPYRAAVTASPPAFLLGVALAAAISAGVFAHASRHGSSHATAWGVAAFLFAGVTVPVYFVRYWVRRRTHP